MTFAVIDNFCPEIDQVKQSLFDAGVGTWLPNKGEVGSSVYEGMGFWGQHAFMLRSLIRCVGVVAPNTLYFRATNKDTERAYIHSDRETGAHTCVCYLTDHSEKYGTAFYRHKPTGRTSMPSFDEMRSDGSFEELKRDMVSRNKDKWEQLDFVHGAKNRAVVFDAPLFHSRVPVHGFGDDAQSARIVWVSHFYKLAPNGELS